MKVLEIEGGLRKFAALIIAALVLSISVPAHAALESWGSKEVYEINNATPGTSKVQLGTRLRGSMVVTALTLPANYASIPVTAATVNYVTSATNAAPTLANGYPGQILTIVMKTDGGGDINVTPTTKTGFTSIVMKNAGEILTLRYVDDTVGWTIVGAASASSGTLPVVNQ